MWIPSLAGPVASGRRAVVSASASGLGMSPRPVSIVAPSCVSAANSMNSKKLAWANLLAHAFTFWVRFLNMTQAC